MVSPREDSGDDEILNAGDKIKFDADKINAGSL
jgi:hypothetical protein